MSEDIHQLADAILHEGYLLYPYRPSSLKNLHRYPFGTLYPEEFCRREDAGDAFMARLECIAVGPADARISIQARFLQMEASGGVVRDVRTRDEPLAALAGRCLRVPFQFHPVCGELSVHALHVGSDRWKLSVELRNSTRLGSPGATSRDEALQSALASAHLLLHGEAAEFVSSIDPPAGMRDLVESCRGVGLWPVLVGKPGTRNTLLAAPIILYDYPELAPESPGDFFDGTEIDELLTLRILTLTDEEKRALADADPRGRALLERTEAEGLARLGQLHGRTHTRPALHVGALVRLRPKGRADIFDLALEGKAATVQAIERDFEGRTYIAVTVDDDPGKDLGAHGHRFFFRPEEVELL